jgi:hypothetical protein
METKTKKENRTESSVSEKLSFDSFVTLTEAFSHVKFFKKNHKYTIGDEQAKTSVSGILKKYEKKFETDRVAKLVAQRDGRDVEDVLNEWNYKRDYSCHKGSEFHSFVENFLERRKVTLDKEAFIVFLKKNKTEFLQEDVDLYYNEMAHLINNFLNFYNWWSEDHVLIKSEFVIGDAKSKLCGSLDNLSYNKKTKKLSIFDYKTNKEIKIDNPRGDTLLAPFTHLQDCELVKYSLQIWLYKLIIERNTPFEVGDGNIVWVSGKDNYILYPTLNLKDEAETILNDL